MTPIRAGAILVMIFQAAYLIGDRFFLPSPMLRQIFPWQTANLVMAGILLILTRTPEFTRYWRQAMWVASAWTMICVAIITTINGERGPLFVTTLLILLGTGTMMPWGRKWQASLEGVGVISLLFHSRLAEWPNALGYYEWAAVLATVGLAHWSHEAAQRSRGQFSNIIRQLTAAQNTLQTKVAELERTERRARESELALRQVIESSPDIITINRFSDGSWVNLNSTLESTSFPTMDGMGATPWEMGLWADKDQMKSFLAELGAHNRVRNLEISIGSKGGQIVPCLVSAVVTEIRGEKCIVSFTRDISNYKDTQRKLHESEAALRKIFDTSPVTITVSRVSDGRFIMVNKWFLEETGYTSEEIIGKSREEIHLWSDPVQLQAFRAQLLKDGFVSGMELKLNHKDGGLLSHLLSAAVTEIGGEQCVVVIGRNITELKETQRKLRDSESTLRKIIDASPVTISVSTFVDGRYIMVNKGFTQETGYTSEESIGKTTEEVGLWVNREQVLEFVDKLREDLVVNSMEMDLHHKDGHIVTHLLSAVVTEIGGRACVVAVGRDITELKEIQRKLHESEATLRKIVEASPVTITVSRFADGRFIMVNNGFSQETGYSSDEVLGKTSGEVGIFGDRAQLRAFLEQLRKDSVVNSMQMELRHKRGFTTTHLLSAVVTDIGGEQCVVAVGRDITELKKYEAELVAAREAALAAGRAKSEFLSSMSHEIRTPMNAVLGMSELLWETELTEEQRRYVNIMKANGDALLDLINDILDLAKIESGRLNLERADFDLEELTGRLGEMMGIRAHEKGLEIAVRIAPGTPVNLVGDPLRLRQILVNLLGNAIKFTEHGQIVLTVERDTATSAANGGGAVYLRFTVRDTGIGIPKDKIGLIFSSFSQADSSTTRRYGGTGLGLAIVNRLVELYGGKISVESEPGVGSTFTFTARLGVQPPQDTTVEPPTVDLHGVRALIVDDTDVNRLILREIVERAGAEVSEASDGPAALDKFNHARNAKKPFGLVLMDCRMPGMDGLDVLRRVQQICAPGEQPPVVVMLTSDELSVQPARLRELGILAYLVKPVRRLELLGAIKRAMTEQKPIIPVAAVKPAPSPSPLHKSPREDHVAAVVLPPLRVLVADDSQDNRLLVKAYLANSAVKITEAENGSEAIAVYKAGKFDVVLMDMRMPLVDGCAATRAIRAWELEHDLPRTPIIALTASALEDAIRECVMAGCDLHVSKPVRRLGLLDAIANVVKHQRPPEAGETHKAEVVIDPVLRDLIPGFLQSKRADVAAVLTALESGDYALASTVAHQLKGEGGAYGFPTVTDLGRALEAAATNTDRDTALRLARELAQYLENVEVTYRP
ncbi:MAG TPA: PAS domain S-box protein [Candidatus Binataceae bacterium]|nr:PAS domain S-box protein [Candidatus Binataceae bacterium]